MIWRERRSDIFWSKKLVWQVNTKTLHELELRVPDARLLLILNFTVRVIDCLEKPLLFSLSRLTIVLFVPRLFQLAWSDSSSNSVAKRKVICRTVSHRIQRKSLTQSKKQNVKKKLQQIFLRNFWKIDIGNLRTGQVVKDGPTGYIS